MSTRIGRCFPRIVVIVAILLATGISAPGQQGAQDGEWRSYGGDVASTKYSPLDQINRDNVADLEIAWRWRTDNLGSRTDFNYQATPLMVGGVLYTTAGWRRNAVAIDGATGETLWMYRLDEGERGDVAPVRASSGRAWRTGRTDRATSGLSMSPRGITLWHWTPQRDDRFPPSASRVSSISTTGSSKGSTARPWRMARSA